MRVIQGRLDEPDSARILICRGLDAHAYAYFNHHVKAHPQWALVMCLEEHSNPSKPNEYAEVLKGMQTSLHKVLFDTSRTDAQLIYWINTVVFPPYNEDADDPVDDFTLTKSREKFFEESALAAAMKSVASSTSAMADMLGKRYKTVLDTTAVRPSVPERYYSTAVISAEQLHFSRLSKEDCIAREKMYTRRKLLDNLIDLPLFKDEVIEQPDGSIKIITSIDVPKYLEH